MISPATKPSAPSFPKKGLVEALAGVVGLLLGVGGSVALDMLNSGFTTARELEDKLGHPVLAAIPLLADKDRKIDDKIVDPARYLIDKPLSRYAELVRSIRVGIQMADVDDPAKVILITSSVPTEGKSTLARSLAFSAVKAGQRVMLLDCDLRHPSLSKYFGLEAKAGLVDFLTASVAFEDAISHQHGVTIIPAGMKSQNPPDLLGSERLKGFVEKLRAVFDYIIIDSSPVEPVIDAKVLSLIVDKVVFAVRWQSTKRELVGPNLEFFARNHKLAGRRDDHGRRVPDAALWRLCPILRPILQKILSQLTRRAMTSARAIATSLVIAAIALALIAKGVELLRFETAEAAAMAILAQRAGRGRRQPRGAPPAKSSRPSPSSPHGRRRRDWRAGRD